MARNREWRSGGARGVSRAGKPAGESRDMPGAAHTRDGERGERGAEWRRFGADAEDDSFARPRGNGEGAERPIPDRERKAEVPIVMDGIGGMVQLVVRRALQDTSGEAGEGDPHVAVAQMAVGDEERHQENVAVEEGERAHARTEGVGHDAEHDPGRKPDQVHESDDLDRMLTQFGKRRHDLG